MTIKAATPPDKPRGSATSGNEPGLFGLPYKWLVVIAVIFGVFMAVLDLTVVNIALVKLQAVFGVSLDEVQWVVTGYSLAITASIPFFGYLAERFGIKRIYLSALVIFTVGSVLSGLAWSFGSLIAFRVLQGFGSGAMLPLAIAQVFAVFPYQERGRAAAFIGVPVLMGPAFGPVLGGYIVEYIDWRLIFYLNVPIGIMGVLVGWWILRPGQATTRDPLDIPGLILSTAGFATLVYGISEAATKGWSSNTVISFLVIGFILLLALVAVELRTARPMLDLHFFSDWNFTAGSLISWTLQIGLFGVLFLIPIFLQGLRGLTPIQAGLWLLPSALVTGVMLPVGGLLVDRFGAKPVILMGAIALTLASYALTHLSLSTTYWTLQLWLIGRSVAIAFTLQPVQVIALSAVSPSRMPRATALFSVMRQVIVAFGTALLATQVQNRTPVHFARLAEQATPFSPAGDFVSQVTALLQARGLDQLHAQAAALQALGRQFQLEATIFAYDDAFLLTTLILAGGVLLSLFLRRVIIEGGEQAALVE
jgi:EmrB/QacA subfamily drug resistance transporter